MERSTKFLVEKYAFPTRVSLSNLSKICFSPQSVAKLFRSVGVIRKS